LVRFIVLKCQSTEAALSTKTVRKLKAWLTLHRWGLLAAGLALGLSVWFVLAMRMHPLFDPLLPGYDMTVFHQWAIRISEGALSDGRAFYQAPLYPYLLGALYALTGPSILAAKLLQAVVGSLTVLTTYLLGCRLFGRRAGLIAAILTAITPIFPFYEIFLLRATLVTLLNIAFLLALHSFDPDKPLRTSVLAGALLGLGAIARANLLVLWPVAAAWVWLGIKNRRQKAISVAVLTLAAVAVISPVTLHNRLVDGQWALISTNFSENWKIGNSYDSTGGFVYPEKELVPVLSVDFVKLQARKALKLAADYEQPNNVNFYQLQPENPWLAAGNLLSWGFFICFGLMGIVLTCGRWRQLFPLYCYLLFYGGTLVLFFVTSRFRVPLWPVLILFSASGLDRVAELWGQRKRIEPLLALALAAVIAGWMIVANPRSVEPRYRDNLAVLYEQNRNWTAAEHEMRLKLDGLPDDPATVWKLAYYLQKQDRLKESSVLVERLLILVDNRPDVLREAGLLDLGLGQTARGVERLRSYLSASPDASDSARIADLIEQYHRVEN
jgi:4-amino-4-deoxy-L-arabinose transferase-like glycosyltransferase